MEKHIFKVRKIILLSIATALLLYIRTQPQMVEYGYSRTIYPWIARIFGIVGGVFPFSLGELLLLPIILLVVWKSAKWFKCLRLEPERAIPGAVRTWTTIGLLLVVLFHALWGLNYGREPLSMSAGIPVESPSAEELEALVYWLADAAADERKRVNWSAVSTQSPRQLLKGIDKGYATLPEPLAFLSFGRNRPKPLLSSIYFSYAGISGIYNPFSGEGNINAMQPNFMLPATAAHELAHYRGIAREDEANFVAWAACAYHEDPLYRYSGHLLGLIHSLNALYKVDQVKWELARNSLPKEVDGDLRENTAFWERYEGWVEEVNREVNDTYLKANRQRDGVQSYGRMVDLLIGWMRLAKTGQ